MQDTFCIGGLDNNSEKFRRGMLFEELGVLANDDFQVEELSLGLNDGLGWNKYIFIEEYLFPLSLVDIIAHIKSLTSSTALIKKGGITELKTS